MVVIIVIIIIIINSNVAAASVGFDGPLHHQEKYTSIQSLDKIHFLAGHHDIIVEIWWHNNSHTADVTSIRREPVSHCPTEWEGLKG